MGKFKYKKQIILGVSLVVFLCVLATLIVFLFSKTKTIKTTSSGVQNNNENVVIPNVTVDNTTFKISDTKNEVDSVNISATDRLKEYNLYYYLKFDDNSEIKNEDYLIFNDLLLILDENCTICFKYELNSNFSEESYEIKVTNIKIPEKETEKATEEELKKEKVEQKDIKTQSTSPYFIKVNYGSNVVTIYTKDSDGNYTVPYKAMVCSCGTFTPKSGTYKTTNKYTWRILINNVWGQYATRIVGSILFHSVPYTSNKKDTLEYWEYDKLGTTASAGCVRLTVRDAKWIYDNCPRGTMVEFYSSSNPGPLGKPSAQKISSNTECRDWDPTDPGSGNPWHTYKDDKEEVTTNDSVTNSVNNINNSIIDNTISSNANTLTNSINTTTSNTTINNTLTNSVNANISNNTTTNTVTNNSTSNNIISNSTDNSITNTSNNNSVVNNSSTTKPPTNNSNNTINNVTSSPSSNTVTNTSTNVVSNAVTY